jgi:D-alanine-D-alanine ligase
MIQKRHIGILFGGKSTEHEISLQSAKGVFEAIDKNKYDVTLIGIDHEGQWYLSEDITKTSLVNGKQNTLALFPGKDSDSLKLVKESNLIPQSLSRKIDVIFPILHGICGEDGSIQGFLKLANIPYVGAGVLGSAIGLDKDVAKRLLRDAGILTPKFLVFHHFERKNIDFIELKKLLGLPFFIKPANTGSSIGVNKVGNES